MTESRLMWWVMAKQVDAALASEAGLHHQTMADSFGVGVKTIRRVVTLFRQMGRETVYERQDDGTYWHRYAPGVRPVFVDSLPAGPAGTR